MDILIVKLGALGDVINSLPFVIHAKTKLDARIHWLVEPLSYPLLVEHPAVDRVILFDKYDWSGSLPEVMSTIRGVTFTLALDLQRILKSGFLCLASRSGRRIGFDRRRCKELTWLFPFERVGPQDPGRHMILQYMEFAEYLGIGRGDVRWEIPVSGVHPFDLPAKYLVLNIGAAKSANKWTAQGFAELAEAVMSRYGLVSVLIGAKEDCGMADAIERRAGGAVISLVGKTTLLDLKEVIAGAKAMVSCDTGPMHLAVALGKDVVALFGPSDPRRTGPFRGEVIQKQLSCVPCNRRECRDPRCMLAIAPADVMERLIVLWSAS